MGQTLATRERVEIKQKLSGNNEAFGDKIVHSEPAKTILFGDYSTRPSELLQEIKENVYKSKKTEVLGKGLDRHYNFPEEVKNEKFAFGIPVVKSRITRWFFSTRNI